MCQLFAKGICQVQHFDDVSNGIFKPEFLHVFRRLTAEMDMVQYSIELLGGK